MLEKYKNTVRVVCFVLAIMLLVPTVLTLFFN